MENYAVSLSRKEFSVSVVSEQYIVEGEMLASKVNEGLNALRAAYHSANKAQCEVFDECLSEYFGVSGFGASMGYFVEKVHAEWPSPESAKMRFPSPGCLHLSPTPMRPEEIKQFLSKIGALTQDPDGYLTGPFIFWSWKDSPWLRPEGNFAMVLEVTGLDPLTMPYDWCILFCGTSLNLHLWGSRGEAQG